MPSILRRAAARSHQADRRPAPTAWRDFLEIRPDQVAALVAWLCSDAAANVNGRTFQVGGEAVGLYPEPEVLCSIHREGGWTLDALDRVAPSTLTAGLTNWFGPRRES